MRSFEELEAAIDAVSAETGVQSGAEELLAVSEEVLEHWLEARELAPTDETREGFRLLALHRQGADKNPSFNACRETCRELAWHYNLLTLQPDHPEPGQRARMMALVANHLFLFISGKMQTEALGEFCCASRPLREKVDEEQPAK